MAHFKKHWFRQNKLFFVHSLIIKIYKYDQNKKQFWGELAVPVMVKTDINTEILKRS